VQKLIAAIGQAVKNGVRAAAEKQQPGEGQAAEEMVDLAMAILTRPAAIFLTEVEYRSDKGPPTVSGGAIVNLGDDAHKVWASIGKHQEKLLGSRAQTVKIGEGTFYRAQPAPDAPELTWGLHGKYLVVGMGSGEVEGILERMGQEPPKWLTAVRRRLPVDRPSMFAFVNVRTIVGKVSDPGGEQMATVVQALGLTSCAPGGPDDGRAAA
jgi:hypothetical protein